MRMSFPTCDETTYFLLKHGIRGMIWLPNEFQVKYSKLHSTKELSLLRYIRTLASSQKRQSVTSGTFTSLIPLFGNDSRYTASSTPALVAPKVRYSIMPRSPQDTFHAHEKAPKSCTFKQLLFAFRQD